MIRTRLTWVVVGAVAALLVVAGVDALRSSDGKRNASTPTASTTATHSATGPVRRCTRLDIRVSIEILGGSANVVVRNVGLTACQLRPLPLNVTLRDRLGRTLHFGRSAEEALFGGDYGGGEGRTSGGAEIENCQLRGPFRLRATVGPYAAQRGGLTASEVGCLRAA